jgi:AICAR transformylase/IMP cyclohydrolase PurH
MPRPNKTFFFGEKVCGYLKSNSIAIVHGGQTLGLGMGQVNRVDAVEQAIKRMKAHHPQAADGVLVSDAFFPFPDSIELAARAGLRVIAQPGGSLKDEEVIQAKRACSKRALTGHTPLQALRGDDGERKHRKKLARQIFDPHHGAVLFR